MRRWLRKLLRLEDERANMPKVEPVRIADLLRGFEGSWVALVEGEVVAAAETPDALQMKLIGDRIHNATVLRVPDKDEPELVGFG